MIICPEAKCVGCGVCVSSCNMGAVVLETNEFGFLYPVVNDELCVGCNSCIKKCPVNNEVSTNNFEQKVYAAWNKNKKIRKGSTSGGMFSLLAQKVIADGGFVFGVRWAKNFSTEHVCINNVNDLQQIRGSKYVQSNTGNTYKQIKELLENGESVLFSGTPCQVHALKTFLGKPFEKLLTVDVICHGVPPYKMFEKHLEEVTGGRTDLIKNVYLRYKNPCWSYGSVRIEWGQKVYMMPTVSDNYFNLFNFNYSLRKSCHSCKYTTTNRAGDITLADFWGFVPDSIKMSEFDDGVSCVIINTSNGQKYFDCIADSIIVKQRDIETAKRGNHCLSEPFEEPCNNDEFWDDYKNGMSVEELAKKYITTPYNIPKRLWLRQFKIKYKWLFKKILSVFNE